METYDRSKIGKCISWIGDHMVYEYGDSSVIKFSKSDFLLGSIKKSADDYAICSSYFGKYILETKIVASPNGRYHASIQPKIAGTYLCPSHMADSAIRDQVREILAAYDRMIQDGKGEMDLIGYGGVFKNCFSNILIPDDHALTVIDASIMEMNGHYFNPLRHLFMYVIRPFALARQHRTIKKFRTLL